MKKIALGVFAHPDDAEFLCTGTLSLLRKAGWDIHIATLAPGDKGTTASLRGSEVSICCAEGFRQHLGHGYPSENILKEVLGEFVICNLDIHAPA